MSKKLLFKGGHRTGMTPYEIEDFLSLYMRDARVDEKTKAYIDSIIGNSVLNLCPYRNVLVTHKYDTVEGNVVTLDDCQDDEIIQLSEIQGNTMVNCNKDTDKELILMPNLDTNGYSNVTLTEGIDGGKVDISLEGNTMVNVCEQEDPIAITKSYTVETGNHIALQGEYDGKCRPNIYGNTLVNIITSFDYVSMGEGNIGDGKYDYSTGSYKDVGNNLSRHLGYSVVAKPNTLYTVIANIKTNTLDNNFALIGWNITSDNSQVLVPNGFTGQFVSTFTTASENLRNSWITDIWEENTTGTIELDSFMILEGDYTNKPIPDYFTGMKSSFEDKLVPENLNVENLWVYSTDSFNRWQLDAKLLTPTPKTLYNGSDKVIYFEMNSDIQGSQGTWLSATPIKPGQTKLLNTPLLRTLQLKESDGWTSSLDLTGLYLVEGDYTNYDFTDYDPTKGGKYKVDYKITGKNKLSIKEAPFLNSGEISLLSWNSNSISATTSSTNSWQYAKVPLENLQPNTDYILSYDVSVNRYARVYKGAKSIDSRVDNNVVMRKFNSGDCKDLYVRFFVTLDDGETGDVTYSNIQLEEGTTTTTHEPYKESIKTLYLNSPLLEGDTIEQSGSNIRYVHRYKKVVLDGSEDEINRSSIASADCVRYYIKAKDIKPTNTNNTNFINIYSDKFITNVSSEALHVKNMEGISSTWDNYIAVSILQSKLTTQDVAGFRKYLQQNPITVVYQLATPTYEIISANDNLLLDSYTNGHLDVDSAIPIDKVNFVRPQLKLKYLYPNTEYTIQFESDSIGTTRIGLSGTLIYDGEVTKGINKVTGTIESSDVHSDLFFNGIGFNASKIVVTPKVDNDFGYFKGMKSVGECEGNKIEILSQNKNLFDITKDCFLSGDVKPPIIKDNQLIIESKYTCSVQYCIRLKKGAKYRLSLKKTGGTENSALIRIGKYLPTNGNILGDIYSGDTIQNGFYSKIFTNQDDLCVVSLMPNSSATYTNVILEDIQLEEIYSDEADVEYVQHKSNKKEILLNEPLRGLPNGIKDKYVIIDGKWYIERNVSVYSMADITKINYNDVDAGHPNPSIGFWTVSGANDFYKLTKYKENTKNNNVCNNLASTDKYYNVKYNTDSYGLIWSDWFTNNIIGFRDKRFPTAEYKQQALDFFKTVQFIFELAQPTYEPINYNPFEVYTDTTHISNNSTIPCNMVIRNSGFNCILKPNTTYTVSSNNGLSTVSTKDSIGDGILRFYDKDTSKITKMSNVLVLEGDYVTGNPPIPAFFKGMESAFEQELVTDENDKNYGKYKVGVLANNENLFPNNVNILENKVWDSSNGSIVVVSGYNCIDKMIKVLPNIDYSLSCNGKHCQGNIWFYDENKKGISQVYTSPFTTPPNTRYISYHASSSSCQVGAKLMLNLTTIIKDYIPHEENNITFYLNEPLRGVGDIKDKVYVKEDKVVVERNCGSITFDGSDDEDWSKGNNTGLYTHFNTTNPIDNINKKGYSICDKLPTSMGWLKDEGVCVITGTGRIVLKLPVLDVNGFKQWLQQNPTTVVYQLATPVYEEVECDLSKLALEGYSHGTLFYNSNIPVTTQFYDFKVNIKDMLIPNETYYITFIADRVKDITINLSGVQVNYKTSMGYNKVPVQLGNVVNTNFSMDSRGVELNDLMISTSTSLIYVKDMNDVCIYDEVSNKYSITITSTGGNESDKRVILLDYPLLRLNKDIYDRLYYNNKDSRYRIDKKVFKHKFTNEHEYSKYAAETNDTYYSSFISLNETIKDYVVITNEKVKTVKVEDDKYYFKIKWSDLGVSDKTEANGNQGMKDFFNSNEVYLYYATDGFVEIVDGLRRQTLKVYQPETIMNFLGNTTTTVTILIPMKNI